jgi:hypothetical protein
MKRFLTPMLAAALTLSAAALVAQDNKRPNDPRDNNPQTYDSTKSAGMYEGTVSQIDPSGSSFVLRDRSGKDVTIYWNSATRVMGSSTQGTTTEPAMSNLKVGDDVSVKASTEGSKNLATSVEIRPKKS